ncbi:MFS transporter [Cryptosporangium aurantiacum]|uniref:Predicted arabinose efflux permease, MFS family n=1 Tax=Cryptosporangium aurantiacum TaxID=134849 RepID=A0A1M7RGM8_9ACTN|nr:MFS transporter [Cryptosporangium aurantiacum]SHN45390.1 Predicted arabinose efflux permease, MFS family [Cryptosporangium aurantiacum]
MNRLVRTRATFLVYAILGFYGWYIYGVGPIVPLLRDEQETSRAVASLHGTALAVGALIAGALYPPLARRLGRGTTLWVMVVALAIGVVVLVSVPSVPVLTIGTTLACGIVGSILVNVVAPVLLDVHGPEFSGAALAEANAIACGVGLVAPLAVGLSLDLGYGWRPALVVASVLAVVILVLGRRTAARLRSGSPTHADAIRQPSVPEPATAGPAGAARRPMPRRYWIAWGIMLCCIAAEFATTLWASDVLRNRTGASAALATAAVTAVIGGMCAGRIVGAALAVRFPGALLLLPALAVALLGTGLFWLATAPVPAMVGLAFCGLGLGPLFPLALDLGLQASEGQTDRAAGYSSYAAGLAIGSGPFVLGALADHIGPHGAFLVVPALFVLAVAGVLAIRRTAAPAALSARGRPR